MFPFRPYMPAVPLALALLIASAPPAVAQTIPGITPTPTPTPRAGPVRITPPITYSLPSSGQQPSSTPQPVPQAAAPPPVQPTLAPPAPTPTPRPTPGAAAVRRVPATASPPVAAAPVEAEAAPDDATPTEVPPTLTIPEPAAPQASAPPQAVESASAPDQGGSGWWWLLGVGLVLAAVGAFVAMRRRRTADAEIDPIEEAVAAPDPIVPTPAAALAEAPRPIPAQAAPQPSFLGRAPAPSSSAPPASAIDIRLIPRRAGMTLLEGVVDFSIVIANTGRERAENILVSAYLRTAHARQDDEIAELLAMSLDPRNHNPFVLASGETRQLDAGLTTPKAMIHTVASGDRRVFVPLLVVDCRYRSGLTTGKRASAAFLIGRERPGSERLGPIPYDGEPRMFEGVAARLHVPAPVEGGLRLAG